MAKTFDPKAAQSAGGEVGAGEYLLAVVRLDLKTSQKNKPYAKMKIEVCAGPNAGRTFYASQSFTESSYGRLGVWCSAMGVTEPFDLSDEQACREALCMKPFKAKIKVVQNGQYTNHDIERFIVKLTGEETTAAQGWILDLAERQAMGEMNDDSDPGYDEDAPPF